MTHSEQVRQDNVSKWSVLCAKQPVGVELEVRVHLGGSIGSCQHDMIRDRCMEVPGGIAVSSKHWECSVDSWAGAVKAVSTGPPVMIIC